MAATAKVADIAATELFTREEALAGDHEPRVSSTGDNRRHVGDSRATPRVKYEGDGGQHEGLR